MADNKLSWTELRRTLANRAGVSEKEANLFLNAFNTQLIEALKQDKQVKINGLGIFRLQAVAPRKSVNVTSGEQITIEGYNKIAFVPEAGVKELVEKGGQSTEHRIQTDNAPLAEIDPIQKLGAQAEEIVDILGELGQSPKEEGAQTDNEPVVEEPVTAPMVEEPVAAPVVEPEPEEGAQSTEQRAQSTEQRAQTDNEPKAEEAAGKKQYHFMRDTLICVVVLLMLLLVGYFFLRHQISGWLDEWANGKPQTETVVTEEEAVEEEMVFVDTEAVAVAEEEEENLLLTENITAGSRLAWIAKKHYGDRVYWPYIYEANKDQISNPSLIQIGTPIRVPRLTAAQRDTTSVSFQEVKKRAYEAVK